MVIQVDINNEKADLFLNLLKELTTGVVNKFEILKSDYEEQKELEQIYHNMTKEDKEVAFSKTIRIDI